MSQEDTGRNGLLSVETPYAPSSPEVGVPRYPADNFERRSPLIPLHFNFGENNRIMLAEMRH